MHVLSSYSFLNHYIKVSCIPEIEQAKRVLICILDIFPNIKIGDRDRTLCPKPKLCDLMPKTKIKNNYLIKNHFCASFKNIQVTLNSINVACRPFKKYSASFELCKSCHF